MEILQAAQNNCNTRFCLGLDPVLEKIPERYWLKSQPIRNWLCDVIEASHDLVAVYKPNLAFFEGLGVDGLGTLAEVLQKDRGQTPVIADAKRGDIGNTSRAYARLIFEHLDLDAITLAPYMGQDSVQPFLEIKRPSGKAVSAFVLALTSNPGSADFQRLDCGGQPLYQRVLERIEEWNQSWASGRLGAVVGATHPDELQQIRQAHPELPLLIPGVGRQGGEVKQVKAILRKGSAPAFVNLSRAVLYGEDGDAEPESIRKRCQHWAQVLSCEEGAITA